jgi:hypothetical protein
MRGECETRRAVYNGASVDRSRLAAAAAFNAACRTLPLLAATIKGADGRANCLLIDFRALLALVRVLLALECLGGASRLGPRRSLPKLLATHR